MERRDFIKICVFSLLLIFLASTSLYAVVLDDSDQSGGDDKKITAKFKDDAILVKFKHGVSEQSKNNLHKKHGSEKIKEFPALRINHIKLKKGMTVEEAIELYNTDPDVEYAEPNYIVTIQNTPNDPFFSELWGFHNTGQTGGTPDADIDASEAWDITIGNTNGVVAVIDTGVDYTHEDLAANMWVNTGEIPGNGIDDDGNGYIDDIYGIDTYNNDGNPFDDNGHGTHVAGTIGAVGNNGIGVVGVNWNVKIMACKFLSSGGYGYTSDAVECLEYIRALKNRGIDVVATNNSWGGGGYSQALYDAINAQRDIIFMAATGNYYTDNDKADFYPANYYLPTVLAVAATDYNDSKAHFSDYGKRTVHVGAPGVNILSTIPDNYYTQYSGTSMATPHVTGLAALIKSQDMNRGWREIKNLVLSGGDTISSMNGTTITGRRINAYGSLTCSNSSVFSALKYPAILTVGVPATLSALSINCGTTVGPVTVTTGLGEVINLLDDGVSPDLAAGDGIFSGTWTPLTEIEETLTFSSPAGTEAVIIPIATPDLVVSSLTVPSNAGAGATITITDTTKNNGPGDAGTTTTKFYFSTNTVFDGSDTYLGGREIPALAASTTNSGSTSVTIPAGTATGTYYIIAVADANNVVSEVTETNNTKYSIAIKIGPDLYVSALTVPASAGAGKSITVSDTTNNSGGGEAGPSTTSFYLSTNT
ncbi:MAG: S8 family serine peptidase, partial [Nitrospirae bacterium]|nr:S8 family serine peptidase [Nitrospirota bacterium]